MPNASASRTIAAPVLQLWEVIRDPHHLPRWWPRVTRVEDVQDGAFTEVMRTRKGKLVRADFNVVARDDGERSLTWVQQIDGTPFARVLKSAETQVRLAPVGTSAPASGHGGAGAATGLATEVTIELRQAMAGYSAARPGLFTGFSARFGGRLVRRAAQATIEEALDGLERISG
jgi:uncharacterized protein YndB with AHSA1/START domain